MAILRNDTVVKSADGQHSSAIITAANIGSHSIAPNSTYYIGTTQNVFNRASGAQTLTGVSIDGNAATVTNGVYTTGAQTIAGAKTFSDVLAFNANVDMGTSTGSKLPGHFYTNTFDGTNVYFHIGTSSSTNKILNLRVFDSANNFATYLFNSTGTASAPGDFRAPIFYDSNNTAYYIDAASTSNLVGLTVANTITGSISGNAGTATVLQTARNINGTSFNGSAAITTATWGTARTLTIGSTGKSVDGSAAVSWSLAEIGAAATNQTMFIGTTSVAINRSSASQTLTGVSIDGNAATVTNGVYTTGTQTIGGDKTFSSALNLSTGGTSARMFSFYTNLTNTDDWTNSAVSIRERDLVGIAQSANTYSPNLNFHWGSRVSNSLWMDANGNLAWGSYSETGVPSSDGAFYAANLYASIYYDKNDTAYYLDAGNTGTSLALAGNAGVGTASPTLSSGKGVHINSSSGHANLKLQSSGRTWELLSTTGAYFSVYDTTGGADRLTVTSGGNVGVATTTADTNLQVVGHIHVGNQTTFENTGGWNKTIYLDGTYHARLRILGSAYASGKNSQTETYLWVDNTVSPYSGLVTNAGSFTINAGFTTLTNSARSPIFYDSDNTSYYIDAASTSNLNVLVVAASARVGGAASRSTSGLTVGFTDNSTFAANSDVGDTDRMLSIVNESSTTNAMSVLGFRVNPNGGTANAMLDIKYVQTGATNTSALHYTFNHGGTFADRFSILSSGNVGIGTTSPTQILDVRGNIKLGGDNSGNYIYYIKDNEGSIIRTTRSDVSQEGLFRSDGWGNFTFSNNIGVGLSLGTGYGVGSVGTGIVYANGSVRAPIFYDSDNTAYYINAASGSNLNTLTLNGILTTVSSGTAINFSGQSDSIGYNATAGQGTYIKGTGTTYIYGGGVFFDGSAIRTLLHSNNYSGYSTFSGSVTATYGNFTTPALIMGDAQYGFYVVSGNVYYKSASGGVHYWRNIANSANTMSLDNSGSLNLAADVRAPIFYDSNDTTYYTDPSSLSNILELKTNKTWYDSSATVWGGGINMGGNNPSIGFQSTASTWWYMLHHSSSNINFYRRSTSGSWSQDAIWDNGGNLIWQVASVRAPIFYDQNNTAFYIDPASSSNLNNLTVAGTMTFGTLAYVTESRRSKNSSNVDIETVTGLVSPSGPTFLEIRGFCPPTMFRTTGDRPAPYGLGFGNGAESGGIMPIGAGDNLQEIMLYGSNTGPTTFTFKRQNWEGSTYDPSNSNSYSASVFSINTGTGAVTASTDIRSPIYYDQNDTSYYLDPASTSVINRIDLPSGSAAINTTTPGTAAYQLNFTGQSTVDNAQAITWGWSTSGAQAGIYVQSSGGYGTKMYIATTDSFATGSKTALTIDHNGIVTTNRNYLQATGSLRAPIFYDSDNTALYCDPNGTSNFTGLTVANTITGSVSGNAGTATILQTARNINGTSFNGSAAITTATWGTARTLTIGSTGKSVDGSAGVSWSLAEIGALPLSGGQITGNTTFSADNHLTFGPNSTWGSSIRIGGNGYTATGTETASVCTTDGNLHLDAAKSTNGIYLNWYGGTSGVFFGNGSSGQVAFVSNTGNASFSGVVDATQFRDASNTAYYLDPNSLSNIRHTIFDIGSNVVGATGIGVLFDGNYTSGQYRHRFRKYDDGNGLPLYVDYAHATANSFTAIARFGGGGSYNPFSVYGTADASGDFRAPIFYDSNDTTYYIDPANGGFNLRGGNSNRVTFNSGDSGIIVTNAEGVSSNVRLGCAWGRPGIYNGSSITVGAETQIDFVIANAVKAYIDSSSNLFSNGSVRSPIFYDSNNTAFYIDAASTSVLNRLTIDGGNYAFDYFQSLSDFTSGTLVTTDIPATAAEGESFVMNVVGKSYSASASPFNFTVQGYLYSSTIINFSGIKLDSTGLTSVKIFENGGVLCFWWPTISYWNAFEVSVRAYNSAKNNYNRVTNITNSTEPVGTKKVTVTLQSFLRADVSATNSVDLRAPIFYDSNNTAFYCDPTATSNFTGLTVANTITGSISGNAGTVGSLSINTSGRNDVANQIVRTDGNGYIQAGWINTTSGDQGTSAIDRVYASYDGYIRYYTPANFRTVLDVPTRGGSGASGSWGISVTGSSASCTGNSATTTLATKATRANGDFFIDDNYGNTVVGLYSATRLQGVFAMGNSYKLTADGTGVGTLYGLAWSHPNFGGVAANLADHGLLILQNGVFKGAWGGGSLRTPGDVRGTLFYDWDNTAYYCDPASTSNLNAITAAGNVTAAQYYTGGWFRNNSSGNGLYNESTGEHFYSDAADMWNVASANNTQGIRLRTGGHNGTIRGYFYANNSNDVGFLNNAGTWRLRIVGGDYALFDGSSIRAPIFYDSSDTNYYCDPNGTSSLAAVNANAYYPHGGVTESDIYARSLSINAYHHGDSLTYDTFQFNAASVYETRATVGASFVSGTVETSIFRGDRFGGMTIANNVYQVRWTWNNTIGYKFFKTLYIANSTNGNSFTVTIESSANGSTWTTIATTGAMSNWPGHSWYNYFWNNNATQGYIRITVTPAWVNAYSMDIYSMRYFCSYSLDAGARLYDWDYNRNVTFPAFVDATQFRDTNNTAYYIDAASTSNLVGLTVANTITGSITGNAGGSSASCTGNAATATILQTARNINGTSFNGSAAITTATWGTARTITIGSTGKSVDGSANVSWSLAELGAAATNQTMFIGTTSVAINRASASQTLTGISIDGSSTSCSGNAATATTTDNINGRAFSNRDSGNGVGQDAYTNNGVGYVTGVSLFSQTDGGMYASAYSTSWVHQIYGDFRTGQIAIRGKNSGTWQAWRSVLDSSNYSSYAIARGGDTLDGIIYFRSNKGATSTVGANNTYSLEAFSSDAGAAGMSFHRGGYYAVNMGLDPDNVLRIGGWSASANRLQLDMSGNLTLAGVVDATQFRDSANTAYYVDPAGTSNLNALVLSGASYFRPQTWIQMDGSYGMYWPNTNGCHIEGNTLSSYGSLAIRGTRGGWKGIHFYEGGNVPHLMFDGSANGGVYFETGGRWASYYSYGNNCWGFGTSTTNSAYNVYAPTGVYSGGRVDGTIFYDSNNTAYYIDPASTSVLNVVTANQYVSKSATQSLTGTTACTIDVAAAGVHVLSLASGTTISSFTYNNRNNNPSVNTIMLVIKYAGTASISWTNVLWANGVTPSLTATNGFADVFTLTSYQGGAGTPSWIGSVVGLAYVSTTL